MSVALYIDPTIVTNPAPLIATFEIAPTLVTPSPFPQHPFPAQGYFAVSNCAGVLAFIDAPTPAQVAAIPPCAAEQNPVTLASRMTAALATNAAALATNATYEGLVSPTNAQVAAQVRALTLQSDASIRQRNAIIRLALGQVGTISDT